MDALPPRTADRLAALEARAAWEIATLSYPARPWVRPVSHPDGPVFDAVVVGGGQHGVATGFALRQAAIPNILLLDDQKPGEAGIWRRFARMETLRSPKHVMGPDLGFPSLTVRAWVEAKFGEAAWHAMAKLPRETWQDYLNWLAAQLDLPTRHETRVVAIAPQDGLVALTTESADGARGRLLARHVVLANGMESNGAWAVPAFVRESLPRDRYAHTAEPIDFTRLAGKRLLVLGAGASAFDNAATALEHGAAQVDLLARRTEMPRVNPNRWIEYAGFLNHFCELPDALRWRFLRTMFAMNQPPPQETWNRCARHAQFRVHTSAPIDALRMEGSDIVAETPRGAFRADVLILGTGMVVDLTLRPELAELAPHAALWRDRYTPPAGDADARLGAFPYLTGDFSFTERMPGAAPWIGRVRSVSFGAIASTISSAGVSMLRPTVERIARGITRDLFLEQAEADHAALLAYDERELVSMALAAEGNTR